MSLLQQARQPAGELLRFGLVGLSGLVVDLAVLHLYLALAGDRPYSGQAIAWCVAVTTNWALNRRFTFTGRGHGPMLRQWARFVTVNLGGAALNNGCYALLVAGVPLCHAVPDIAVAAGTLAGMLLNFSGSRRLVFRG